MVGLKEKIHYKSTNLVPPFEDWNYGSNLLNQGTITIYAGSSIQTTYDVVNKKPGRKPSKYRRFVIEYGGPGLDQSCDYSDKIALYEKLNNITGDDGNEMTQSYVVVPLTIAGAKTVSGHYKKTMVVEALNCKSNGSDITIVNNSTDDITIYSVKIQRSNDTWGQESDPQEYINTDGGVHFIDETVIQNTPLVYTVPVMSLAQWNSYDKTLCNEAIIVS